ncbi:hypothetical protein D3C72_2382990 [compost metagenome]
MSKIEGQAFRPAGKTGRRGHDGTHRAIGEFEAGGDEILGFHLVQARGFRHGGDGIDFAAEAEHQVE